MSRQAQHFYEFGDLQLDITNRLLYRAGVEIPLAPKLIETLLVLLEHAHTVVDKDTLVRSVWSDAIVEEGGIARNVSLLRKALGEDRRFIETLPKRGYRFTGEVHERWREPQSAVEFAPHEVVVQRRARLQITQEEEEPVADQSRAPDVATDVASERV